MERKKVPNIVGVSLDEAKEILEKANIEIEKEKKKIDIFEKSGTVVKVEPKEETSLKKNEKVVLYVSDRKPILIIILLFLLCALFMIVRKGTISTLINTTAPVVESKTHEWAKTGMVVVTKDAKMIDELKNYEYCVTNKKSTIGCNWQITETKNAEIVASGEWYVYFRGIDVRGRRSKVSNREYVNVDNENPVVKKIKEKETENTIKVTIEATDRLSGVNSYFYKIDNQEYVLGTKTHEYKNLEANKEYKITIKVVDKVGNEIEVSKKVKTKTLGDSSNSEEVINPTTKVTTSATTSESTTTTTTKVTTTEEKDEVIPIINLDKVPLKFFYGNKYDLPSYYKFGPKGGEVKCIVDEVEEATDTSKLGIGKHKIVCTAYGNNGINTTVEKEVEVAVEEVEEEEKDGWIWLNLHYPANSTKWEWKKLDENEEQSGEDLNWKEYTGPIRVRVEDVDKIIIRYEIDGNEIIITPDGYYVDIEPEKTSVKAGEVTKVKINYGSNVEKVEYRINNGVWQEYTSVFEVGPNTSIEARIRYLIDVYDDEGNLLLQKTKKKTASGYIGEVIESTGGSVTPSKPTDPSKPSQPSTCTTCSCVDGSYNVKIVPTSRYVNNNLPVKIRIDYEDGVTLKQYKLGINGTWQNYTGEITVTNGVEVFAKGSGYKEIDGCTKWVSGTDVAIVGEKTYKVEVYPARTSIDSTETTIVEISTWIKDNRVSLEYSINGGEYQEYTNVFEVGPNTTIVARAKWILEDGTEINDQASATVYENKKGLRTSISSSAKKVGGINQATIEITTNLKADKKEYTLDNGASWKEYTGPFGVDANTLVCAKSTKTNTDGTIQTSPMVCKYISEDDLNLRIIPSAYAARKGGYVTAEIKTDYNVEKIEYSLDKGATWNEYTGARVKIDAGSEILARATYKGKVITTSLSIDILAEPSVILDGPSITGNPENTLTKSVDIEINTKEVARDIFYRINRGSWIKYTGIFNVTSNVKIEAYYVRDSDGKTSAISTYYVQNVHVGNKPYVRIDTEPKGYLINGTQDKVKVKISGSNYNTLEYSLDGINYQPYTNEFEVTTSLTVYARATNDVGTTTTQFTVVTVNPPKVWKNLSVKIVANPDSKDLIDKDGNVKLVNETEVSLVYGSDVTSACYKVLNGTNSNQTNALANQQCIPYTGAFKVNQNETIYAYVQSADGKGTDVKLIDFLTLGIASPVINVDQTSATSLVKVSIDYARSASIKKYRIDNGPWTDYTEEFEVTANCTIEAMNEDILGNQATSSLTINNIVRKPVYNILDKGDYYLIKLNYPSNSTPSTREYKWLTNGTWKTYDEHGILLIKPSAASKIVTPDGVKITDDKGNEVILTDHYYILTVDLDKVGENIYMRWDKQKVEAPKIIVSEEEETVTSVDVAVSYHKALVSKLYRVIYDDGTDTGWLDYNGKFKVTDKGIVYAKGVDIDGNDSEVAEQRIDNIDSTGPVITVTGDLVTPKQKVTLLISATDDGEVDSLLYEVGSKKADYFKKNGKGLKNPTTITFDENGKYTFYAVDALGNETIKEIEITNIDKTAPDIEITVLSTTVGTSTEVEINYGDAVTTLYKVGENGTYQSYTGKFTLSSYDLFNLKNQDGSLTIYAKGIDQAGNEEEVKEITYVLDLDAPKEPTIVAGALYPTLTEYGVKLGSKSYITYDSTIADATNYYSLDNGATWKVYTGPFDITSGTIKAKTVKNKSGLTIEVTKQVDMPSDALGPEAYDGNTSTSISSSSSSTSTTSYYLDVSPEVIGSKIVVNYIIRWGTTNNVTYTGKMSLVFMNDNNVIASYSLSGSKSSEQLEIPENTTKIRITMQSGYHSGYRRYYLASLNEITLSSFPVISNKEYYPTLTEYGVSQGYSEVTIDYFQTSVKRLYRINEGEWKEYQNKKIRLELGDKIESKGIDKYGVETNISSYSSVLPSDALGPEAYDGNTSTSISSSSSSTSTTSYYLDVSPEVIGSKIVVNYIIRWGTTNNVTYTGKMSLVFMNDNNVIASYSLSGSKSSEQLEIPENTTKIRITMQSGYHSGYSRYYLASLNEISINPIPVVNQTNYYPTIKQSEITMSYIESRISYLSYFAKKLYSLDNGTTWLDYTEPIKLKAGDVIQAKAIDKDGNETEVSTYTVKGLTDNLDDKAFDKDQATSVTLSSKQTKLFNLNGVDNEVLRIYTTGTVNAGAYIKLYDKDNKELANVTLNTNLTTLVIPEGSVKASIYSGTSTLTINEVNLREVKVTGENYPEITINDTNWTTTKTVEITYPEGYKNEYSLDLGTTWNEYTEPITVETNTTIFTRVVKDEKVIGSSSFVVTSIDNVEPEISLDIDETIDKGTDIKIPTSYNLGISGGTTICKTGETTVTNISELEVGTHEITCTVTNGANISKSVTKNVIIKEKEEQVTESTTEETTNP